MATKFDQGIHVIGEALVVGNLTVQGTTTTVESNEVNIGDSIILLNADETGSPTEDAGLEVERGTETNSKFLWDETLDRWTTDGADLTANTFIGPLTGDVTGNVTGNVTGDVTGNVTGDVTGNLTGNVTGDITSTGTSTFSTVQVSTDITVPSPAGANNAVTKSYVDNLTAGVATETYVQNYVQANAGSGTVPVAASPELVTSGTVGGALSITGIENGQVLVIFITDSATSNMSTLIRVWDQAGWAGFNPSSTQLASTTSAHLKWVNTTGATKDIYIQSQLTTTGSVGRIIAMKFAEDFAGDYNDLTNTPTIPSDVSDLTDNTGLLSGGGGGFVTGATILSSGGSSTNREFPTAITVQDGQTIHGWSNHQPSASMSWYDNYQGSILDRTNYGNPYTNSSGSAVTVYARCTTTNSADRSVTYQIFGQT